MVFAWQARIPLNQPEILRNFGFTKTTESSEIEWCRRRTEIIINLLITNEIVLVLGLTE